jgi:hypothetical protein
MKRLALLLVAGAALVVTAGSVASGSAPAIKYKDDQFGAILATPKQQALYY